MKRKFFLKLLIFLVLLYLIDFGVGTLLKSTNDMIFTEKMLHDFYNESENIDLVFMGSSHVYRTFDPYFFQNVLELNTFNLGSPFQNPTITYFLLKELIRLKHHPKMIVLETYWPILCGFDTNYNSASYVFHYLKFSWNKIAFLRHAFEFPSSLRLLSRTFHYRRFVKNLFYRKNFRDDWKCEYRGKGFIPCEKVATAAELTGNELTTKNYQFNAYRIKYFEKTIELARQHDIEVLAVMTPVHPKVLAKIEEYPVFHQKISEICRRQDIRFIDLNLVNQQEAVVMADDFMDHNHLNLKGARKINHYLAPFLAGKIQQSGSFSDRSISR